MLVPKTSAITHSVAVPRFGYPAIAPAAGELTDDDKKSLFGPNDVHFADDSDDNAYVGTIGTSEGQG